MLGASGFVAQVSDRIAVNVIFAHEQGLQPVAETLCAFANRGHNIERQVKRPVPLAVEAPARDRRAFARQGRERPCRIMPAIAASLKPQAKPPSAR